MNQCHENDSELWQFCMTVGLRGAGDLRKTLGLDEGTFRHVAPSAQSKPSKYFLYRVLDEIQKASITMMHLKHFLSDATEAKDSNDVTRRAF